MALTLLISGAQSCRSGTRSLSSSGSTQSARPSPSLSRNPSSATSLQLSSIPLQASVAGVPGVQVPGWPLTQAGAVRTQAPVPQEIGVMLSSTVPLQSSSMLLQTSGVGVPGVQGPGWPPTQAGAVRTQAPVPQDSVPRFSSTAPLQSSSRPLHSSTAPGWIAGLASLQSWVTG